MRPENIANKSIHQESILFLPMTYPYPNNADYSCLLWNVKKIYDARKVVRTQLANR